MTSGNWDSPFFQVFYFLTVLVYTSLISAVIFVCIELPWLNSEKLLFSILLGKSKKNNIDKPIEAEVDKLAKNWIDIYMWKIHKLDLPT